MAPSASYTITEQIIDSAKSMMASCLTTLAQMSMGQVFLRVVDRGFWIIEKSAQWSLPCHETQTEENGKSFQSMELVRPLPWVLFLPGLILLRLCRFGWNVGSSILGYPRIEPSDIVKYVQKTRRRLRAIKANGIKTLRQKRGADNRPLEKSLQEANRSLLKSIQLTLSSLSCLDTSKPNDSPPATRIQLSVNHEMSLTPDEKSTTESTTGTFITVDQKRKYSQLSSDDQYTDESEEETLNNKIDRLVREGSYNDHDFEPEGSSDDETSSEADSEEEAVDVSQNEVQDLIDENNGMINAHMILRNIAAQNNSANDIESTCPIMNEKSPVIELAGEQQDYFSPQSGDDGEAAFYSPISSKSSSPERVIPTFEGREIERKMKIPEGLQENCNDVVDEKIIEKSNGHADTRGSEPISISNKCATKFQNKSSHKGKRMIHGTRKKK